MRKIKDYISVIALVILNIPLSNYAQPEFSGFADFLYFQALEEGESSGLSYGQFELDISAEITPGITFEGAIAYDPDDGLFEPGAAFVEFLFEGNGATHGARGGYFGHIGLMIGQFDVPFGLDWQHIASPNRRLVTAPLLIEKTINGWNDTGLNLHGDMNLVNFNAFAVNGADDGIAIGGRLGVPLFNILVVGASFFTQTAENDSASTPQVLGADLEADLGSIGLRFEYQQASDILEGDFTAINGLPAHSGYYGQLDFDLTDFTGLPLFLIARYDKWATDTDSESADRLTLGTGYVISDGVELRIEYLSDSVEGQDGTDQLVFQTLVSF